MKRRLRRVILVVAVPAVLTILLLLVGFEVAHRLIRNEPSWAQRAVRLRSRQADVRGDRGDGQSLDALAVPSDAIPGIGHRLRRGPS